MKYLAFIGLILLMCLPASATNHAYIFSIVDTSSQAITDANFTVTVYDYGTTTAATIYSDDGVTTYTNPMIGDAYPTSGKGTVIFWGAAVHYTIKITSSVYPSITATYSDFGTTNHIIVYPLAEAVGNIQAGTITASGAVTLNGNVTLGDANTDTITFAGSVSSLRKPVVHLAVTDSNAYTVTAAQSGTVFFADGNVVDPNTQFNLPTAVIGLHYIYVDANTTAATMLRVHAASGDSIKVAGTTGTANKSVYLSGTSNNESIEIVAIDSDIWQVIRYTGTLAVDNAY